VAKFPRSLEEIADELYGLVPAEFTPPAMRWRAR